jgi:hypothetical protein
MVTLPPPPSPPLTSVTSQVTPVLIVVKTWTRVTQCKQLAAWQGLHCSRSPTDRANSSQVGKCWGEVNSTVRKITDSNEHSVRLRWCTSAQVRQGADLCKDIFLYTSYPIFDSSVKEALCRVIAACVFISVVFVSEEDSSRANGHNE